MRRFVGLIVFLGLVLFSVGTVDAQFPRFGGKQAMQMFSPFGSGFDPGNIVEISGKIKKMINVQGRMIPTVAAIIDFDGEEYEVRLGPMMFIRSMRNFRFRKGTKIDVVGSNIEGDGDRQVIIAQKIIVGGNETVLRDEMGIPVWAPISKKGGGMFGMMRNMLGGGSGKMGGMGMMGGGGGGMGMMGGGGDGKMGGGGKKMGGEGTGGARMGGGPPMMGGGSVEESVRPPSKTISGEAGQEIEIFGDGDADEEAEDLKGGKIPGGYKGETTLKEETPPKKETPTTEK